MHSMLLAVSLMWAANLPPVPGQASARQVFYVNLDVRGQVLGRRGPLETDQERRRYIEAGIAGIAGVPRERLAVVIRPMKQTPAVRMADVVRLCRDAGYRDIVLRLPD